MKFFTAGQVVKMTGVPYGTLNYWAKVGLVRPSVSPAKGSGSLRRYDFTDLLAIRIGLKLRKAGITGKYFLRVVELLRNFSPDGPQVSIEITDAGDAIARYETGETVSLRHRPNQLCFNFSCDYNQEVIELTKQVQREETTVKRAATRKKTPKAMARKKVKVVGY